MDESEILEWLDAVISRLERQIEDLLGSLWLKEHLDEDAMFNMSRAAAYQDMLSGLKQLKRRIEGD